MTAFELDPRLAADTLPLGELGLSRLLLMNDRTYPWLILVPRRAGLAELIDLPAAERHRLMDEIALVSTALRDLARPDKINVGALGNMVRQLHVHVIARFTTDPAWAGPVWGKTAAVPYSEAGARDMAERLAAVLGDALRPM
ncbi:HIT domain-containing protein [Oharaeibacter diazotrophicus]|uniref:Diadenosine tetraphosphate (Ap4A) HIT family hydrolase n=1 Tax=Oharaeibacter diazotrophicus TaxID=1920512 RepID=A0A4R6R9L2_9HYPH|nr:HIT family protein [Oharaeibacter diazotrophicus]TDP82545.1 diadenosine tetraphosphate (Ap4A) HIT family hydrolase [Oharaeibacter diazotrophicus]BBE72691.1 HIT domain protein [Pleomorphomonas sp. SM30]GLS76726.1 histidine triad protein [Oharaeibacter diazotrophicus]